MSVVAYLAKRPHSEHRVAGSNPVRKEVKRPISLIIIIYAIRLEMIIQFTFPFFNVTF